MATERQMQKAEALLKVLRDYLQARFDHATRINPSMRRLADELMWQQLATVRQIFLELKSFGPERFVVIDILTSFDMRKRGALFSLSDQNTIFNEIVSEAGKEKEQKKFEGVTIGDIGSFYKAIDPSLEHAVLLIQSWIWWDLPDAMDLVLLDLQAERVKSLRQGGLTPEILSHYRQELNQPGAELTVNDAVALEMKRATEAATSFRHRRTLDPGYRLIIKRDPLPDASADALIQTMAQRLRVMEQVQKSGVDATLKEHYSRMFKCDAEAVTPERIVAFEREALAASRAQLRRLLEGDGMWGEPYDYKQRQLGLISEKLARIDPSLQ